MRITHIIPLLFVLIEACTDPLKIKLLPETQKFVVDGLITNDPGPYEVKLSYSLGFDKTTLKKPPLATGASVWIYDNFNTAEKLSEVSPGVYQTGAGGIRGQVGREYYIKIKTKFGREYQSLPQRLSPAGEITNVSFEFDPLSVRDNAGEYVDGVKIIVDSKGVANEKNLLRWRWNTIYKARTFPEFVWSGEGPDYFPGPEKCSGYVYRGKRCENKFECLTGICYKGYCLEKIAECACCECWPYGYSVKSVVSQNRTVSGMEFKEVDLGNIETGTQQFYEKYYIKVEQLSVSEDVYEFWKLVGQQQEGISNIFQPNSGKVKGNIKSLTDPNEEVLGIFGVSGITKKELYIPPDVVPYDLPALDTIFHDCGNSFQTLYTVKPSFW